MSFNVGQLICRVTILGKINTLTDMKVAPIITDKKIPY